jgi:hypothetical protein
MIKLYKLDSQWKETLQIRVDKENKLLLASLDVADDKKIQVAIDSFFLLREQRRVQTKLELNSDIESIEQIYETMEGTARYVEYSLYKNFAQKETK